MFKILATFGTSDIDLTCGANVTDFFRNGTELLRMEFDTPEDAIEAAKAHYLGVDTNNVGLILDAERV